MPAKKQKKSPGKRISTRKPKNPVLKIITIIAVLAIFGVLAYSVVQYQNSQQEKEGFFVCNKENTECELSQHIHADLKLTVCGKEVIFDKEKGNTQRQHTHKEKNKLHWHAPLKVDPKTRKPLDPTLVTLGAFFKEMEYTYPKSCPKNQTPEMTVLVNDKTIKEPMQYVWKDGDKIEIDYE